MNDVLRTVITDDEEPARELLREYLAAQEDVEVVACCANGFETVKAVSELRPDLLFLDVRMPKLDGFDVIELLGDERPAVVFVTAYDQYAVEAFEVHALDYLLKPASAERVAVALERVRAAWSATGRRSTSSPPSGWTTSRPRTTTSCSPPGGRSSGSSSAWRSSSRPSIRDASSASTAPIS
jgi:two-component system LytT family response regulator